LSRRDAVAPRSRREFSTEFPVDPGVTGPARVAYAAFEDGYYEGSGRAFERWLAARDERREDLAYWTKALMSMPRISEPELRTFLSDHVAVRASGETHWTISHVSDRVQSLLLWVPQGGGIWPRIDQLRKEVEAEYLAVTRTPPEKQPGAAETGTAATVVSTDVRPAVSYTVILENLREVPIEAYSVADYDLARGRVSGWTGTDFCTSEPDAGRAGRGRIMPHEKRDLGAVFGSGPTVPLLKLYYVMFDDLQYEGEPVERVRLLKKREAQAEEHTFALAALDEAAGKPASELEAFLVQKREAYLRQMQRDGKGPAPAAQLEWFVGNIRRTSAERFAAEIPATRERLVGQIARLRRHLAP
jgi:hypothetical protein